MRLQRSTLMALALLAMLVAADGAASASKEGRPRKRRGFHVGSIQKVAAKQKEKCTASKSDPYYQVRMNITAPAPVLRGDYAQRALCPWTYRVDIDNRRFPIHISHAVCAGHCGGYNLNWVEIRQQIMVLKKEQTGCTYTLETMNVVAGCACVRSDSVPAGSEGVNSMETRLSLSAPHSIAQ